MLNGQDLEHAVDLQKRSHLLLTWMGKAVGKGLVQFETAHDYSTLPDAAERWIAEHFMNILPDARPAKEHLLSSAASFPPA